nr:hypothetical protein [Sulfurospirillum sp. 'SP']
MNEQIQNLKIICGLLGIDTSENGLTGCPLANSYLQRIIQFLGG